MCSSDLTPAGLHGWRFNDVMKLAHRVVVPLQPSMFDILATQDFLARLADDKRVRHGDVAVGGAQLARELKAADAPTVAQMNANLSVARAVLGPISRIRPRFVRVPLDIQDPTAATLLAGMVTLTPSSADLTCADMSSGPSSVCS